MGDEVLISTIVEKAREIFGQPALEFDPALVFQNILGFDSVRAVQFILALEETLGVMITEEEVDTMFTFGDALTTLRSKAVG
jgi:acyl carrier protein